MKNYACYLWLMLILISAKTHVTAQDLSGSWVKTKITYLDGYSLGDEMAIKNQYLRYTFDRGKNLYISSAFDNNGMAFSYDLRNEMLIVKNINGITINHFKITKNTDQELELVEKTSKGFDDPNCLKYFFVREAIYQNRIQLTPNDVISIQNGDTLYKSSPKIYAKFIRNQSLFDYCRQNIPEWKMANKSNSVFLATFVIRKSGHIDSIRILESFNKKFENQFLKAISKTTNSWEAAHINGANVDVQMTIYARFLTSDSFLPMYDYSEKGRAALFDEQDHAKALSYFELALKENPDNVQLLYYKALCLIELGNIDAACDNLTTVKASNLINVDELIRLHCGR